MREGGVVKKEEGLLVPGRRSIRYLVQMDPRTGNGETTPIFEPRRKETRERSLGSRGLLFPLDLVVERRLDIMERRLGRGAAMPAFYLGWKLGWKRQPHYELGEAMTMAAATL